MGVLIPGQGQERLIIREAMALDGKAVIPPKADEGKYG
jgi:hypothetical protein